MPEHLFTSLLLLGTGVVAGMLNSIAGGGSLITLPVLIFLGLPATVANATNRIALFIGAIGSTHSFAKRSLIPVAWLRMGLPPALLGVFVGTWGATRIPDVAFERVLAVILLGSAALILWQPLDPELEGSPPPVPSGRKRWWLALAFFGLGTYSGFIQAGVGFLFLALFASQGLDLIRANALKVPMILAFTMLATILFAFAGILDWVAGLTLAVGQFVGAKIGVHLQVLKGQAWVRSVLIVAIAAFSVALLLRR